MNSNDVGSTALMCFGFIFVLAIFGGVIALFVYALKKSNEQKRNSEIFVTQLIQNLPENQRMLFFMQYNNVKKDSTTAILLALFLGGVGAHKFYLGQTGLGILYLVFVWTYIPSIIATIELFTLAGQVGKYNEEKAREISLMVGGIR